MLERIDRNAVKAAMEDFRARNPGVLTTYSSSQERNKILLEKQVDDFNARFGRLGDPECDVCRNKGFVAVPDADGIDYHIEPCPRCGEQREGLAELKKAGLTQTGDRTLDSFRTYTKVTQVMKANAEAFIQHFPKHWLFYGGQSGCGKTHVCTAAVTAVMARGFKGQLVKWPTLALQLKKLMVTDGQFPEYQRVMHLLQTVDVLYIDDFWRTDVTDADCQIAMEILDERYNHGRATVISSERYLTEISEIDEAIGGRIFELALKVNIKRGERNNRRTNPLEVVG